MCFLVKKIKSSLIESKNYLNINGFFPKGLKKTIKSIPDNSYVLGVGYEHGDNQVCISGHPKLGESLIEGLKRELKEELYMITNENVQYMYSNEDNYFYKINIKDTRISREYIENNQKDSKKRVIICVYGTELEILNYMINLGDYNVNNDYIDSIWSCTKEKILKIIN